MFQVKHRIALPFSHSFAILEDLGLSNETLFFSLSKLCRFPFAKQRSRLSSSEPQKKYHIL